ncbi:hypothetical protein N0V93_002209 [Gnomoniopsis smithogilvyi]|uniref:Calcineurin-like phosphoesterase domain-containing protein n=1 Tax=Gnomoniopsis smithogilvyi TaxID=1191159 RepID=A0A9W8YYB3_9PEZI|nr:hypothetical protein N0V93_002209 [Gnomoniopsis smithogilvyi]
MLAMFSSTRKKPLDDLLHRPRPSPWTIFWQSPVLYLAHMLYTRRQASNQVQSENTISVVCVSDTHNSQPQLPYADILIHAGDLTQSGSFPEVQNALDWIKGQPHPHKVVVAGNHDLLLDPACDDRRGGRQAAMERQKLSWGDVIYLQDSATEVVCGNGRKLRIYGSPMSCRHGNWAFQYPRSQGHEYWPGRVPDDTNILVTHGPPRAHLDLLNLGCPGLLTEVWRVRPTLHVFGHVHEGYGTEHLVFDDLQEGFERVVVARGGVWNLTRVVWAAVRAWLAGPLKTETTLVNPAMVGGLRDDQRRTAIKAAI